MPLTRAQIREIDRRAIEELGLPGVVLMENAGRSVVELLEQRRQPDRSTPVVIVCGKGNNAGDGFVVARHLENRGFKVEVLLAAEPGTFTGDAAVMYRVIERSKVTIQYLPQATVADWIAAINRRGAPLLLDALLGTGLVGDVREPFTSVIHAINASGAEVISVDIPSGLDCDTGRPLGCAVKASLTVTFVAQKQGFDAPAASDYTGEVLVADIGIPRCLREAYGLTI